MYEWKNDAKIKEPDISWQSIETNIQNILNKKYKAKTVINLNIIEQDESSILKRKKLKQLNNIDHKLSEAEMALFSQSQNEFINTLEKFKEVKNQLEALKSAVIIGCPLSYRERDLQKIIAYQADLKDIKDFITPIIQKRLNEALQKKLSGDGLSENGCFTEEINGLFCSKLFNFIAHDAEYIDSLSILKDHTIIKSEDLYIIPTVLVTILDSIKYWLKWFPSCFIWYTENILKNCTLNWEILATENRFKNSSTPLEYLDNFELYINTLNEKIEQLEKIYNTLWAGFDYFRRLIIERYIEHIKKKKRKAVETYINKTNTNDFLPTSTSAKDNLDIFHKANKLSRKIEKEFNLDQKIITSIKKLTNSNVLEKFIFSILNCGKESLNEQFNNKRLVTYLIEQDQANAITDKIYEIYSFIDSSTELNEEQLRNNCHYIAVSYLSNNSQEEVTNLQNHLYNAIKTKKDIEFVDYKHTEIGHRISQNIHSPYWKQATLDLSPVFNQQQNFIYDNWANKTTSTAIAELQNHLFSAKSLLNIILNCRQQRLGLYEQATGIFAHNFQKLLDFSLKNNMLAPELEDILIILKKSMPKRAIKHLQDLIKENFRQNILTSTWSVVASKILINLTPKLSKKYFLEGLHQAMTNDNIGDIFYRHIRNDVSIFRILGIKKEDRRLVANLVERILANHLQDGHYINTNFLKGLISIENFSNTYLTTEQKNAINLLLKLEDCIERVEGAPVSSWANWRAVLKQAHDLAQITKFKSEHTYTLFIQKLFLACSIKWKKWLMLNNFQNCVLKANELETEVLSTVTDVLEYRLFEHLFDPWKVICKYSPYVSTAGLNILTTFRCISVNHLRGIDHQFYIAILQLGLYSTQICNDIKNHCTWLLSKNHNNTKYRKNIYELQSLLNDTNPYYLRSTENIFHMILAAEIPPKINKIPLIDCYPNTFMAEKVFFKKNDHVDIDEKSPQPN